MRLIDADALKKLVKAFRNDAPQSSVRKYVCDVILSMLGDENQAPTIDAGPQWISVRDKLPERNKRVLVAFKDGMVTTSMRTLEQHTGVFGFLFEGDYGTATHWMPLPNPPKEG